MLGEVVGEVAGRIAGAIVEAVVELTFELATSAVRWGLERRALQALDAGQREALLEGLLLAAYFDGHLEPTEFVMIAERVRSMLGADGEQLLFEFERARIKIASVTTAQHAGYLLSNIAARLPEERVRRALLRAVAQVAVASSTPEMHQRQLVERFGKALGRSPAEIDEALSGAQPPALRPPVR
jgi:uncharacterized tellurite resistance protein B-like protein